MSVQSVSSSDSELIDTNDDEQFNHSDSGSSFSLSEEQPESEPINATLYLTDSHKQLDTYSLPTNHQKTHQNPNAAQIWHKRLGHVGSERSVKQLLAEGTLPTPNFGERTCAPCEKAKYKRSYRGSLTNATKPGALHADVVGQIKPATIEGYKYFCTVTDELTRFVFAKPIKAKGDASFVVNQFMM
ncbi:Ribonuclease H [Gracilaria domingensis]|nr:Ribonuclease H [Gracilaria domingensis]